MNASASIRRQGAKKILIGGTGFVLLGAVAYLGATQGRLPVGGGMIVLALPGAYALAGLMEASTGVKFSEMSTWWDELRGWQRGLLGLLVVALAFATLFAAVLAADHLGWLE